MKILNYGHPLTGEHLSKIKGLLDWGSPGEAGDPGEVGGSPPGGAGVPGEVGGSTPGPGEESAAPAGGNLEVVNLPNQIDTDAPLAPQVEAMVEAAGLDPGEWQTLPLLINLPSLNYSAAALLAHLHGIMGYFPPAIRLRPVKGAVPPRYQVAEIMDLQGIREKSREKR